MMVYVRNQADTKEFLLPSKPTEVDHEPKYVFTPSQSYSAGVWMGANWAQPICWAPWMCYLAETFFSFFFSYFFLFFSAGKWWRSSGQCSQVSPSFYTGAMPSVCVRLQILLNQKNITKQCVCACLCVHGHVYTLSPYVSPRRVCSPSSFLVTRCFNQ